MALLRWEQGDKYHQRTRCGRYSVCVGFVADVAVYQAWLRGNPASMLLVERTHRWDKDAMKAAAERCREACQRHADNNERLGEPAGIEQ